MVTNTYDIAIIGGGINGCGIARDAAGRGMSVFLAEKGDLASGTSSASTKLIHGGLRYLEHYKFRLVRESLIEREILLRMAPHLISPLRFVLPHNAEQRPVWMIRLGLFMYDHLGGRKLLPGSNYVDLRVDVAGHPLRERFSKGFEYSDCWVDDARLVALTALDAAERGAHIQVRTEVTSAVRQGAFWKIETIDTQTGQRQTIEARMLINAAGPWVANINDRCIDAKSTAKIRLVKGSHVVVPRMFDHDRAYIFQNADNRIIFAIPYETDFTLIGTTDVDYQGRPDDVSASPDEIAYLCAAASEYFTVSIKPENVVWTYSGVRPLFDDGSSAAQEATRDYVLDLQGGDGLAPVVSVFGGKITTYRRLSEEVLAKLGTIVAIPGKNWTADSSLPGGDFDVEGLSVLTRDLQQAFPGLDKVLLGRLARSYGTRAHKFLNGVTTLDELGEHFGAGLYALEVEYLLANEWAVSAEDVLWRRTKLGLKMTTEEIQHFTDWMQNDPAAQAYSTA